MRPRTDGMMSVMVPDLFTCPAESITFEAVSSFVGTAIAERLQAESLVLEFKKQNDEGNIAKAVAAMANTDGGLVLVGVDESAESPLVGVPRLRHDAILNSLRARIPDAMPEVIPVAIPGTSEVLLLILRVDPEMATHPVVIDGKVYKRIPGNSIGARRDEIVALCNRSTAMNAMTLSPYRSGLLDVPMWDTEGGGLSAEVRARATFVLPRRLQGRGFLGSAAMAAVEDSLRKSAVPERVLSDYVGYKARDTSWWDRTSSTALRLDLSAEETTHGPRARPLIAARANVYLHDRQLEASVSVRLEPREDAPQGPAMTLVSDIHDVLLVLAINESRVLRSTKVAVAGSGSS